MATIPFGEWLPDSPTYGGADALEAQNVFPRTGQSYGSWPSLSTYSAALTARCQGAMSGVTRTGVVNNFAGDATKLYRLQSGTTWTDASKVGNYTTGADERWAFAQFGQRVLATNYTDAIQSLDATSSLATKFADLSASAPKARYISVVRDFVMVGNTDDTTDGKVPNRVWWSAIDDATSWPTIGSSAAKAAQSDYQNLEGDGGWIQGIVGGLGTADAAIFQERRIVRATYVGSPVVFQFDPVEGSRGTPAPGSIAQLGSVVFYLGEDGFYAFDGTNSTPIGANKIDKTFFNAVDQTYFSRISAAVDPINKLVVWAVPVSSATAGDPGRLYIYSWQDNRWSYAEQECELLYRSLSFGQTLEGLDSISSSLDALPFSLDSRAWTGNRLLLSAFDRSHRLCYFNGASLAATIDTSEYSGGERNRVRVRSARPLVEGTSFTATVSTGYRDSFGGTVTYSADKSAAADGTHPQRIDAKYVRHRVKVAAGGTWTHAQGVETETKPGGRR